MKETETIKVRFAKSDDGQHLIIFEDTISDEDWKLAKEILPQLPKLTGAE